MLPYVTLTLHYVTLVMLTLSQTPLLLVRSFNNITLIDSANGHFSL